MTPRTFATDVAKVSLSGASLPALEALGTALVKALPDVMEVDPQEIGVQASTDQGDVKLTFWDTTAGGTGVSLEIPQMLPQLLRGARDLLALCDHCSCQGKGCFGCIQPFSALNWQHLSEQDELDELEAEMMQQAPSGALRFVEQLLGTFENKVIFAIEPSPTAAFTQVILELDNVMKAADGALRPGVAEVLKVLHEHRVDISVVTNGSLAPAITFLDQHLPDLAAGLKDSLISDAGLPALERVRHLIPEERPDRTLWVSGSEEGVLAARNLSTTVALLEWQKMPERLALGPDLLLDTPHQVATALFKPSRFSWPLEQVTLPLEERHSPVWIRCPGVAGGLEVQVLGRYFPMKSAERHSRLLEASQQLLSFKTAGALAPMVSETLRQMYPDHIFIFMPSSQEDSALGIGLKAVHDSLAKDQHDVGQLRWTSAPRVKQKYAGSVRERIKNIQGKLEVTGNVYGKDVLLIDDVVTSGATLAEGRRVLEQAGARVTCFAVAHTMLKERGR
ncbi:Zn-binding domain-containing protein [Deinococcus sp. SL84]|uniref:Zn-binding domain-containing protein n=1 Tax=Deinococcus sp. SL84 TaxID=2994663 RepID=UPI0022758748|nr:Zn-binding domain-containing protein [Deinococcus sp. SL84]MCY1703936.1 DUF1998 domain-containing protein [Deinococcus sp. SL84]